jgi:hypothetical protein
MFALHDTTHASRLVYFYNESQEISNMWPPREQTRETSVIIGGDYCSPCPLQTHRNVTMEFMSSHTGNLNRFEDFKSRLADCFFGRLRDRMCSICETHWNDTRPFMPKHNIWWGCHVTPFISLPFWKPCNLCSVNVSYQTSFLTDSLWLC